METGCVQIQGRWYDIGERLILTSIGPYCVLSRGAVITCFHGFTASSCSNVNFAFRGVCNRCGTARPAGAGGTGGGAGRGRGRGGGADAGGRGRSVGGPTGLFGPNDWPCPM